MHHWRIDLPFADIAIPLKTTLHADDLFLLLAQFADLSPGQVAALATTADSGSLIGLPAIDLVFESS